MSSPTHPDLVKITEVFLIPNSFLVAAIRTADSNPHRAAVSVIGLVVSLFWWISSWEALAEWHPADRESAVGARTRRVRIMSWLPVFVMCWAVSVVVHIVLWNQPLGR